MKEKIIQIVVLSTGRIALLTSNGRIISQEFNGTYTKIKMCGNDYDTANYEWMDTTPDITKIIK